MKIKCLIERKIRRNEEKTNALTWVNACISWLIRCILVQVYRKVAYKIYPEAFMWKQTYITILIYENIQNQVFRSKYLSIRVIVPFCPALNDVTDSPEWSKILFTVAVPAADARPTPRSTRNFPWRMDTLTSHPTVHTVTMCAYVCVCMHVRVRRCVGIGRHDVFRILKSNTVANIKSLNCLVAIRVDAVF